MDKPPVLVVPNTKMIASRTGRGVASLEGDIHTYLEGFEDNCIFMPRAEAEENPNWRQLIPYCYISHNDQFLVYSRKVSHTEQRLANKLSIGFGGHIEPQDSDENLYFTIIKNIRRELAEEALILAPDPIFQGWICNSGDDAPPVSLVHVGLVFEINLDITDEDVLRRVGTGDESRTIQWIPIDVLKWEVSQSKREMEARGKIWEDWTVLAVQHGLID